jgi:hypothetical protein
MGAEVNQVTLLDAAGGVEELPPLPKDEVAERVVEWVVRRISESASQRISESASQRISESANRRMSEG